MHRGILALLCSLAATAQPPQLSPFDAAFQAYHKARAEGRFDEAAAKRDEARALLARTPIESDRFASQVQMVSQLYQSGGMYARGREVLENALSRTAQLPDANPTRVMLLNALASFWQEDRNLLKALPYLEKAAAALESAPPPDPSADPAQPAQFVRSGQFMPTAIVQASRSSVPGGALVFMNTPSRFFNRVGPGNNLISTYQRLVTLYQQLGRPEAVNAVIAKMKKLPDSDSYLAGFYESQGKFDDAAAVYQKQASQASQASGDSRQSIGPLQQLAFLYQREQRYTEAAAVLQQAITTVEASGGAQAKIQSAGLYQSLAEMLRQAGQTDKADQVYQQVLAQSQNRQDPNYSQLLLGYANYLANSDRGRMADTILSDYAASQTHMEPWQETNLLYARAGVARRAGDTDRAAQFEREATARNQANAQIPPEQMRLQTLLQKANQLANSDKLEEAFSTALEALAAAPRAADREQIAWQIPSVAYSLARKETAKAVQLYQQLFAVVESWSSDNLQPLLNVTQNYPRFLMAQKGREGEVLEAIDRYRKLLVTSRGAGTGFLEDPLQLTIEFERAHGSPKQALLAAQDLLALQESLNGATSEPYLRSLESIAELYEHAGEPERTARLFRQAIAIGDLVYTATDGRRAFSRMRVAMFLARQQQFDEAESMAAEAAIALSQQMRPPQPQQFTQQLEQIRRMKAAATTSGSGEVRRVIVH